MARMRPSREASKKMAVVRYEGDASNGGGANNSSIPREGPAPSGNPFDFPSANSNSRDNGGHPSIHREMKSGNNQQRWQNGASPQGWANPRQNAPENANGWQSNASSQGWANEQQNGWQNNQGGTGEYTQGPPHPSGNGPGQQQQSNWQPQEGSKNARSWQEGNVQLGVVVNPNNWEQSNGLEGSNNARSWQEGNVQLGVPVDPNNWKRSNGQTGGRYAQGPPPPVERAQQPPSPSWRWPKRRGAMGSQGQQGKKGPMPKGDFVYDDGNGNQIMPVSPSWQWPKRRGAMLSQGQQGKKGSMPRGDYVYYDGNGNQIMPVGEGGESRSELHIHHHHYYAPLPQHGVAYSCTKQVEECSSDASALAAALITCWVFTCCCCG